MKAVKAVKVGVTPWLLLTPSMQHAIEVESHMLELCLARLQGLDWDIGAIGTATWSGVRLRDVLTAAGGQGGLDG
jgi:hypothetical protein